MLGDQLIVKAAEVFKKECRSDDIIARIGGDEFTVLLPKTGNEEVKGIVNRIRNSVLKENIDSITCQSLLVMKPRFLRMKIS
jgi:diguanylate cyclase (GGDEF)-like protein